MTGKHLPPGKQSTKIKNLSTHDPLNPAKSTCTNVEVDPPAHCPPRVPASLFGLLGQRPAAAQTVVHSSTGYQVNISIMAIAIVPHNSPCTWGYNYDVRLSYSITFSGAGAPSSMYTLQGTVGCGSTSLFFDLPNGPSSGTVTTTGNAWRSVADCATATIASLGCTNVNIQIQGPGIPAQTVHINSSTLPITLGDFGAHPMGGSVWLNWTTSSEQDNAYFTVERSLDAVDFLPVMQQPGAGNSTGMIRYSALDANPYPGISFYRLKQTDMDGHFAYSPTVVVNAGEGNRTFSVFPNPCTSREIELPPFAVGKELKIRTITGEVPYSMVLQGTQVLLPRLAAGTYLLQVTDPRTGNTSQCRFIQL